MLIAQLNNISEKVLSAQEPAHFEQQRTTGSMVLIDWDMVYQYSGMAKLVAHPKMIQALAELGFAQPKFGHGRIISKPAYSPPLFWHEDGRFWDDPVSYTTQPIQCFLMVLSDRHQSRERLFAGHPRFTLEAAPTS